jgi:CMP-N,N'-diacetyllegionaminic acid synthase
MSPKAVRPKILAFIGARGGSKGLKNKNIAPFAGKPLIHWTIRASLGSRWINHTLVSTDSPAIAAVARRCGADVPFLRPAKISGDEAKIEDAIRHALQWFQAHGTRFDYVVLLQPTSPLRTAKDINSALRYYFRNRKSTQDTLVSVTSAPLKVGWLLKKTENGYIRFCFDLNGKRLNRQGLPRFYLPNGVIYIAPASILRKKNFYTGHTIPYVMTEASSADIDSKADLKNALKRFRSLTSKGA